MSEDSFNSKSTKVVTILTAGTASGLYRWSEVNDENHILQCRNEVGPPARLEGKVFSIQIRNSNLRVFKYRNFIPLIARDKSVIKAQDGSVFVMPEEECFVLEFYEPSDFSSLLRLNPTNSISDLYDTILKSFVSVDDFLKVLEADSRK